MRTPAPLQYSLLDVARAFMVAAHCSVGQVRKYTGEDYFHHPEEVLQLLLTYDEPSLEMQVAALLHDVIEDTNVKIEQIRRIFGMAIAQMVDDLSDVSKPEDGNRETRKRLDREHIGRALKASMRIKCADLLSNSKSIVDRDVNFARTYLVEKLLILEEIRSEIGNTMIWKQAFSVCCEGIDTIWPDVSDRIKIYSTNGFSDVAFALEKTLEAKQS